MYTLEVIYCIIFAIITLLSQFLPTDLLLLLDNIFIRIIIVILLLYLITNGPTVTIFGFVMIATLYLERNRRKVYLANKKFDSMDTKERHATVEEASLPQTTVPVNDFDTPIPKERTFLPDNHTSVFEPVSTTINEKHLLASVYPLTENGKASIPELYQKMGVGAM